MAAASGAHLPQQSLFDLLLSTRKEDEVHLHTWSPPGIFETEPNELPPIRVFPRSEEALHGRLLSIIDAVLEILAGDDIEKDTGRSPLNERKQ